MTQGLELEVAQAVHQHGLAVCIINPRQAQDFASVSANW